MVAGHIPFFIFLFFTWYHFDGLGAVAAGCPNLQHLDLDDCWSVTVAGLGAVAAGCPRLQHVQLGYCGWVTDAGLRMIPQLPAP